MAMGDAQAFPTADRFFGSFEQPRPDPLPLPAECDAHPSQDQHTFFLANPQSPADLLGILGDHQEVGGPDQWPIGGLSIEGGDAPEFIGRGDPNPEHLWPARPFLTLDGG
jgi:hypothetical protein